jgi:hypothetical protein
MLLQDNYLQVNSQNKNIITPSSIDDYWLFRAKQYALKNGL